MIMIIIIIMIQLLLTAAAITTIATISSTYIVARITLLLTTVTVLLTTTTIDNYNNVNDNTVNTTFPCMIFFVGVCPFSFPLLFFFVCNLPRKQHSPCLQSSYEPLLAFLSTQQLLCVRVEKERERETR